MGGREGERRTDGSEDWRQNEKDESKQEKKGKVELRRGIGCRCEEGLDEEEDLRGGRRSLEREHATSSGEGVEGGEKEAHADCWDADDLDQPELGFLDDLLCES